MPYHLELVQRDITSTDTEAIVNAANNHFWMGSGVAGAIKRAGGETIEQQAVAKGPVMTGEAIHTGAGELRFKYIIHAAVMGQDLRTSDKLIRQATVASLNLAEKLNIRSIAFPAFGTGVGGFPMKACANLMIAVVRGYRERATSLERVQFCLFDDYGLKMFSDALAEAEA
ncbi:MAG: macro domain-containing protein [candidate division Zixibacteria bacterium]|nr:macro domain-containing protein [candidate division Zixibacteria bacterium]